jgi:hypothetical protein
MVQITGKLFSGDTPARGSVVFQPSSRITHSDEDIIVLPSPWIARVDEGSIRSPFMVPANDDGNPSLGTYKVTERIVGQREVHYHIQVLAARGSVQDLSDLAPIASSSGFSIVKGDPGEQGEQGIQGEQGEQGIQGDPGLDTGAAIELVLGTHIQSPTPHPVYDDTPDLTLIFQNGLT